MKKKAQAAMEFLSTYGFALLIIVSVIAVYFTLIDPTIFLPTKAITDDNRIQLIPTGSNKIYLSNVGSDVFYNVSINVTNHQCYKTPGQNLYPGESISILLLCEDLLEEGKEKFLMDIYIEEQSEKGNYPRTVYAELIEIGEYFNTRGLREYWPFNGNAQSLGSVGTELEGNVLYDKGMHFEGAQFNGAQYLNMSLPELFTPLNESEFTLSFFMRGDDMSLGTTWTRIFDIRSSEEEYVQTVIHLPRTVEVVIKQKDVVNNLHIQSNQQFDSGTWYLLTIVWNGYAQSLQYYVNGVEQTFIGSPNPSGGVLVDRFTIGMRNDEQGYFTGMIDEVFLYNRTLSQQEISALGKVFS